MTVAETSTSRLKVKRVVGFTFSLIHRNLLTFFLLSTIVAVPAGILRYQESVFPGAALWDMPIAVPFATYIVAASLLTAIIARTLVPESGGSYPSLTQSLAAVVRDFIPLVMIALISGLAVVLGLFLLVLPGVILGVILAVVMPVRIIERTRFVQTFVRSAVLTNGDRWPILGLLIASIVIEIAGVLAVNAFMGDPVFAGYSEDVQSGGPAAILSTAIINGATSLITAAGTAVLYCELRRVKDGPAPRELAAEFD